MTWEVDGQQVDRVEAVLFPVGLPHHHHGLLGDPVGSVGRLRVPLPQVVLAERDAGRLERIRADGADLDELLHARLPGLLHQVDPHRGVVVEERPGMPTVPADAAGVGREMDDDVLPVDHFRARIRKAQVVPGVLRDRDVLRAGAPLHEDPDQRPPQEPRSPGDQDLFIGESAHLHLSTAEPGRS
jgi:hypothetical protein